MTSPANPAIAEAPGADHFEKAARPGPLPAISGRACARVYRRATGRRNVGFDRNEAVTSLPRPVIPGGNPTVGVAGKPPPVAWSVLALRDGGAAPCASRRATGGVAGE